MNFDELKSMPDELVKEMLGVQSTPIPLESLIWPRPIPVGERLPEPNITVLAYDTFDDDQPMWIEAHVTDGEHEWYGHRLLQCDVQILPTHWLPLPPAPGDAKQ